MPEAHDTAKTTDSVAPPPQPAPIPIPIPLPIGGAFWPPVPSPEEQAKLRAKQSDQALEWVQRRFPNSPPCPWCGKDEYTVTEVVVLYPQVGGVRASVVYPVIQVICTTCGYTQLFNAAIAGIIPEDQPPPESPQEAPE